MGTYYIKIDDGPDVRRKILESSKAGLHVMHGNHDLQAIRSEKLALMNRLRVELKELNLLVSRLDTLLPELTQEEVAQMQPKPLPSMPDITPQYIAAKKKSSKTVYMKAPGKSPIAQTSNKVVAKPAAAKQQAVPPMTELQRLQQALEDVESKLDRL